MIMNISSFYVSALGISILMGNEIICPECAVKIDDFKENKDCPLHSIDTDKRLSDEEIKQIKRIIDKLQLTDDNFINFEKSSVEIKGFSLINHQLEREGPFKGAGFFISNNVKSWISYFLIEKYFNWFTNKKNAEEIKVYSFHSHINEGAIMSKKITQHEVDDFFIKFLTFLKENPFYTHLRINMTAGDRILYPYYLYLDSVLKWSKKDINSQVYMIIDDELVKWTPFPTKQPTRKEMDEIKRFLGKFHSNGEFSSITEREYKMFLKSDEIIKNILVDCVDKRGYEYYLNTRGKLLHVIHKHLS